MMHEVMVKGPETEQSARDSNFWLFDGREGEFRLILDYAQKAPQGQVLELGSGGGRLTQSLAHAGLSIVGLELSDTMLQEALRRRQRADEKVRHRLTYMKGDMRSFRMGMEFSMVIVPFATFWKHMTREQAANCLACIKKVLVPGGMFLIDTPQEGHPDYDTEDRPFWSLQATRLNFKYVILPYRLSREQNGVMLVGKFR